MCSPSFGPATVSTGRRGPETPVEEQGFEKRNGRPRSHRNLVQGLNSDLLLTSLQIRKYTFAGLQDALCPNNIYVEAGPVLHRDQKLSSL